MLSVVKGPDTFFKVMIDLIAQGDDPVGMVARHLLRHRQHKTFLLIMNMLEYPLGRQRRARNSELRHLPELTKGCQSRDGVEGRQHGYLFFGALEGADCLGLKVTETISDGLGIFV